MSTVTHYGWYLGNFASIDGNLNSILGTYGSAGSPVHDQAMSFTTTSNDADTTIAEDSGFDTMSYSVGATSYVTTMDEFARYNVTATLDDGSVINIEMWAIQSANGDVILVHDNGADNDPLESNTAVSLQLTSTMGGNYTMSQFYHDQAIDMVGPDGTVEGEAGDDTINLGYDDSTGVVDNGGDQVTNDGNIIEGQGGDDLINAGSGNDTIYGDFADQGASYLITNTGDLYLYEPGSGDSTLIQTGLEPYGDIATTPDGSLYGVVFNEADVTDAGIYQIDPQTGVQTLVIDLPEGTELHSSLAADGNGGLYVSNDNAGTLTYYASDGAGGFLAGANAGTIPIPATDILILDDDTAWVTANGVIYQYDIDGSGNFTNETNLGTVSGDTDVFGLSLSADGSVLAYEGSGEVWSTDPTSLPLTWSAETDADLSGSMIWGTANAATTEGADSIYGGGGDDVIDGGEGADFLSGDSGDDTLLGGEGNDTLIAGNNSGAGDSLSGGAGDDVLTDSYWNATLDGGDGSDVFNAGYGTATIIGGEGGSDEDTLSFAVADDAVNLTFSSDEAGTYTDSDGDSGTFTQIEAVTGSSGDDTIDGSADGSGLLLDGLAGADSIAGGSGADTLIGGAGDDTVHLADGFGADTIVGGETTETVGDTLDVSSLTTGVTVTYTGDESGTISDGFDTANFSEIENLILTDVADYASVFPIVTLSSYLDGGGGDDTLVGSNTTAGSDTLVGGAGNDDLRGWDGADSLVGGSGDDLLTGDSGADTLIGGAGDDTLTNWAGAASMDGGDDSDTFILFDSGGGSYAGVTITGGEGGATDNDTIDLSALSGAVTVDFTGHESGTITNGLDTISFSQIESLILTDQGDLFDGTGISSADYVQAGDGDDTINYGAGGDTIDGGDGNDWIRGAENTAYGDAVSMDGGAGDDTLQGSNANDTVLGGTGDDALFGYWGNDSLDGGDGDDTFTLYDGFGEDTIVGGEGGETTGDELDFSNLTSGVQITLSGGPEAGTASDGADTLSFSEIESFILSEQADSFDTNNVTGSETVSGLGGDDTIRTQAGDDSIDGGDGADSISAGQGADTVLGGDGDDFINAQSQDDYVDAGAGSDTVLGGQHSDTILGGSGADSIDGQTEDDSLTGGLGDDTLTGGSGDDTFNYSVGDGADTITDFNFGNSGSLSDGDSGNNDFIDLSAFYDDIWELHADQADDGVLNQSNDGVDGVDYSDNSQFGLGDSLTFSGASADGSFFTVENTGVVCFAEGTLIRCAAGERPIEDLRPGDLVQTMDNGLQAILSVEQTDVPYARLRHDAHNRPIWLSPKLTGGERPLIVSPQHCLLLQGHEGRDRLIKAAHLARMEGGQARVMWGKRRVRYLHLMLERHEILFANNMPAESFYPGRMAVSALCCQGRRRVATLFPDLVVQGADKVFGPKARGVSKWKDLPDHIGQLSGSRFC